MDGSSPRQRAILEALPPTLLYAVAKPSAPAELVEQVKNGDITTNKQYQEAMAQIKAEKDRADAAETREEEARKAAHEYHEKYEEAAAMRATLLDQQGAYIADIDGLKNRTPSSSRSTAMNTRAALRPTSSARRPKVSATGPKREQKIAEDALKKAAHHGGHRRGRDRPPGRRKSLGPCRCPERRTGQGQRQPEETGCGTPLPHQR